jgi:phosphohistidine phosphatase
MKQLILMRHAKSSWADSSLADHDRPLNQRGEEDAPRMGQLLTGEDLIPDMILCSTAERAKQTVEGVLTECSVEGEVVFTRGLYHADPEDYIVLLQELPDAIGRVMMVAHNPGMEYFLSMLTDTREHMPTAAIALIDLPIESWGETNEDVEGKLAGFWIPKEL